MNILKSIALLGLLSILTACVNNQVSQDNLMRGSVVRTSDNTIVVSFGSDERIEPGERFTVYRTQYTGSIAEDTDQYTRKQVGEVRILKILKTPFARARIITGEVESGDIIEQANSTR
jgi:hypothetical protein